MSFLDVRTPFFRPLWRRVIATAVCLAWAVVELVSGSVMWAIVFGASGLYLSWQFFVVFRPATDGDDDETRAV